LSQRVVGHAGANAVLQVRRQGYSCEWLVSLLVPASAFDPLGTFGR
jgi:hypothetical protein